MNAELLIAVLITVGATLGLVLPIRRAAFRIGAVDRPNSRKIHTKITARLGGVAIILGVFIGVGALTALGFNLGPIQASYAPFFLITPFVFLLGFLDDILCLRARWKFMGQILLALGAYLAGFRIETIAITNTLIFQIGWFGLPVTVVWIVAVMNAVNLIDGIDGLAGGISTIAFVCIGFLAFSLGNMGLAALSFIVAAASLGFLAHNFPPATIFMGDSGSLMLGFLVALFSMSLSPEGIGRAPLYLPLLLLMFPFTDVFVAIFRRFVRAVDDQTVRRKITLTSVTKFVLMEIFAADGDHIHHRLLLRGYSPRRTVGMLCALFSVGAVLAVVFSHLPSDLSWVLVGAVAFVVWQLVLSLEYEEFAPRSVRRKRAEQDWNDALAARPAIIRKISAR